MLGFVRRSAVSNKQLALAVVVSIMMFIAPFGLAKANADAAALEAELAEAMRLLEEDTASRDETENKKRMIEEKIAEREKRQAELLQEFQALCAEQEKLQPGSFRDCVAKIQEQTNN